MPVIAVTGGVATGKSTVARNLVSCLAALGKVAESFSADEAVHVLLDTDLDILASVRLTFGDAIFESDGRLNKLRLREIVFADTTKRRQLEAILHPHLRQTWTQESQQFRGGSKFYIAEIPLLYETQAETWFDCVILVAASRSRQMQRLSSQRGWPLSTSEAVIVAQLPLGDKIQRADILIWNDFTNKLLDHEVRLAAESLEIRYAG